MARATARPTKRPKLGQNFLTDPAAAEKIVAALGDIRSSTVIEIGPGQAVLTSKLAARTGRLIAIELDRVLAAQLSLKFLGSRTSRSSKPTCSPSTSPT